MTKLRGRQVWNNIYYLILGFLRFESPLSIFSKLKATFWPMFIIREICSLLIVCYFQSSVWLGLNSIVCAKRNKGSKLESFIFLSARVNTPYVNSFLCVFSITFYRVFGKLKNALQPNIVFFLSIVLDFFHFYIDPVLKNKGNSVFCSFFPSYLVTIT